MAKPGRILVIDDEKLIQAFLRTVLERGAHRVFSALDAMQATMMARQVKPHLVVLDINMPGGGGYAVFERLRMMSSTMQIPVLIYSAATRDEVAKRIPETPDVVFIGKPAAPELIAEAVERLLGLSPAGA
jgi:CheY-like chemotaxis protein